MSGKRRIVILTHADQPFGQDYYLARIVAWHWQAQGHEILVHHGLDDPPDGDLAILHVDTTVLPPAYLALARRYPRHINAASDSIAKRAISSNLVRQEDDYGGAVIVKTDANHRGFKELELYRRRVKRSLNPITHLVWRYRRAIWKRHSLPDRSYPIYQHKDLVPAWMWRDRRFVVEAFRPEFDGELYYVNSWYFLGDRGVHLRYGDTERVSERLDEEGIELLEPNVPAELWAARRRLGLSFGKMDFVINEGECVLLDVSRTPASGRSRDKPKRRQICAELAAGLDSLFAPERA